MACVLAAVGCGDSAPEKIAAGALGGPLPAVLAPTPVPPGSLATTPQEPTAAGSQATASGSTTNSGPNAGPGASGTTTSSLPPTTIRAIPAGFQNGADVVATMRDAGLKSTWEWRKFDDEQVAGEAWVVEIKEVPMVGALGGVVRFDAYLDMDKDGTTDLIGVYMNPDLVTFAMAPEGILVWYEGKLTNYKDDVVTFAGEILEWPDFF